MKLKAKKLAALLSAAVLAMAMSVTALAAGSVSTSGVASISGATDKNGNAVTATISEASVAAPSADTVEEILGSDFVEGMTVKDVMDVSVPEGTEFPVTITFSVAGITADSNVAVLHYNGSAWEKVSATAGNGTITATFTSLSPVAIVADTAASSSEGEAGAVSPKTGETVPVALIGAIAVLAAVGAYGLKKKEF